MSGNLEIAAKLDEARALIERGWCQGLFEMRSITESCFCLYGAVNRVVAGDAESDLVGDEYFLPLARAIGEDRNPLNLAEWNDAPGRTQAEVVEAFRKAADLARGEAS